MSNYSTFILLLMLICLGSSVHAQSDEPIQKMTCVTDADYQESVLPLLRQSYQELKEQGKLFDKVRNEEDGVAEKSGIGDLQWPLRMAENYVAEPGVYDYFQIWNYADLEYDGFGARQDWMCNIGESARNYDNHNGVDIVPHPFRWHMQEMGYVDVIAAADGEVLFLDDDNFDLNCGDAGHIMGDFPGYGGYGNFVALLHDDGSVTLYGHMKSGSVADLEAGDEVEAGQYLGKVGSSGNSSDPHLHFEVRECLECPYFEPWYDPAGCNTDVAGSWWADQRPYYEPQVLRLMTHFDYPDYYTCASYEAGGTEGVYGRNHFVSGATVYIGAYMRDFLDGDALNLYIYNNAGTIQESWSLISTEDHYYGYSYNATEVMSGDPDGTYRLAAVHDGKTYNHYFTLGCTPSYSLSGSHSGYKGYIAGDFVTSTASISGVSTNQVLYEAENYVLLNPGFVATANSTFQARIDDCTIAGLKEEEEQVAQQEMQVYPNPTDGMTWLYLPEQYTGICTLRLYNMHGALMTTHELQTVEQNSGIPIDLTGYAKGMYLLHIDGSGGTSATRIVVQ